MSSELVINASLPEVRIALMEDGEVQELLVERASDKGIVGNIYKGRVTRVLPGMQAAFVDIGLDKAAFLYVDDIFVDHEPHEPLDEVLNEQEVRIIEEVKREETVLEVAPFEVEVLEELPIAPIELSEAVLLPVLENSPEEAPSGEVAAGVSGAKKLSKLEKFFKKKKTKKVAQDAPAEVVPEFAEIQSIAAVDRLMEIAGVAKMEDVADSFVGAPVDVVDVNPFEASRGQDRRIRSREVSKGPRVVVNIQDLLKEGQEVIVQVAKDAISTKGARLTCHISLPGRHLVCMPTINHVGVSRRIDREDERRRLRECVEKYRSKKLGFIVRTASGKGQSERRVKQDIDYLTRLWSEIKEKAMKSAAPALVYEDLNAVLRSVRDWITEDTDKLLVDSKKYFSEIQAFVSHFMPSIKSKVELYQGDIPIFDAYNISTELSRALERKVWLKSGGYIVIDQAEALVAIDVNTGRFVGKKNLEDTILKTNLEAVKEIAYQLRLRNCGGIIILDLIDMEKEENKHRIYRALEEHLQKDRARPSILKISELGLIEMTRKRTRDTIIRTLCEPCSHCEGKGYLKSKQTIAYEVLREIEREAIEKDVGKILVQAHSDVIDVLAIEEKSTLDQIERKLHKQIYLQSVQDFHIEQFEVTAERKDKKYPPHTSKNARRLAQQESAEQRQKNKNTVIIAKPEAKQDQKPKIIPKKDYVASEAIKPVVIKTDVESVVAVKAQVVDPMDPDEEDRLAFLRAQAAQDAALVRLGTAPPMTLNGSNSNALNISWGGGDGNATAPGARKHFKHKRRYKQKSQQNKQKNWQSKEAGVVSGGGSHASSSGVAHDVGDDS